MTLLYFAWVRERLGRDEERIALPPSVRNVAALVSWLRTRGPAYDTLFEKPEMLRVAVNQVYAKPDDAVQDSDEVAIFPPVTGG